MKISDFAEQSPEFRNLPSVEAPERSKTKRLRALYEIFATTRSSTGDLLNVKNSETPEGQTAVYEVAKNWVSALTKALNCSIETSGFKPLSTPCLFASNHVSYLDIPVLMSLTQGCFVAKKEVQKWPIFGRAAQLYGTVFLDRKSSSARKAVAETIADTIENRKRNVILFPEGTSTILGAEWKRGAFAIAKQFNIPVQPIRIAYKPHSYVAYWGDQTFVPHLWKLLSQSKIHASVEFLEPRLIRSVEEDTLAMQTQIQNSLKKILKTWNDPLVS